MDSLLLFINHMVDRLAIPAVSVRSVLISLQHVHATLLLTGLYFLLQQEDAEVLDQDLESYAVLFKRRQEKEILVKGTAKFDENPKAGLLYLEEHKMISSLNDPVAVAQFLKSSTRLSKKLLGEYIAKPANLEVLKAFIRLFDFDNVCISTPCMDMDVLG